MKRFNWEVLLMLTRDIPNNLDRNKKKEPIPDDIREAIRRRDKVCQLCGKNKGLIVHHIIPNGSASPDNLILLCRRCHKVVHEILAISGKWKEINFYRYNK